MDCQAFVHNCRKCKKWYQDWDKTNPCSECGEDRHCTLPAVEGYRWCDRHGGPAPHRGFFGLGRGIVSGSNSGFPLFRLAEKYNEARKNGSLMSNRAVLEVLQERLVQLLDRIDRSDAPDRLQSLHELWEEYNVHLATGNHVEAAQAKVKINLAFDAVFHDYAAWEQALKVIDLHRKTAETEVKIFEKIHAVLTAEKAYELVAGLAAIVMRIFPEDPKRLKQVQYEFTQMIGEKPDNAPERIESAFVVEK